MLAMQITDTISGQPSPKAMQNRTITINLIDMLYPHSRSYFVIFISRSIEDSLPGIPSASLLHPV